MCEFDGAGAAPCSGEHVLEDLDTGLRACIEHIGAASDMHDGNELPRIVWQRRIDQRANRDRAIGTQQNAIAVGSRAQNLAGSDGAASSANVLDYPGLARAPLKRFTQRPHDGVHGAANGKRNGDLDRLRGIVAACRNLGEGR